MWLPKNLVFSPSEQRLVQPREFKRWVAREYLERHGSWVCRVLRLTNHPSAISTAIRIGVAVRLEVRSGDLYRHWVVFSERESWLKDIGLPEASLAENLLEHCLCFQFQPSEPPLKLAEEARWIQCRGRGVHSYAEEAIEDRVLSPTITD